MTKMMNRKQMNAKLTPLCKHKEDSPDKGKQQFRLLAFQPLAISMEELKPISLIIQGISCILMLRPVHEAVSEQRSTGGTYVVLDFILNQETDFIVAANIGLNLIEDFLSAVAIVDGATFQAAIPMQIARFDDKTRMCKFIYFKTLFISNWSSSISQASISEVKRLLAHWDGLDSGKRLRRAARQYRKAIGNDSDLLAFQEAYVGLEALEKPLAVAAEITPGCEEIQGECETCGAKYTRRRTVLAGVRAYVSGEFHSETATELRRKEWSKINKLRHKLVHSLDDTYKLEGKAGELLPVIMHYLHDAICCLSHSHDLESDKFKISRFTYQPLFVGRYKAENLGSLEQWGPLLDISAVSWVKHRQYGLVPEYTVQNKGLKELELGVYWLRKRFKTATENDLSQAPVEHE